MKGLTIIIVLGGVWGALMSAQAAAPTPIPTTCPDLAPRLVVGQWARVVYDHLVNLRPQPTTTLARLGTLSTGMLLKVLDGEVCAEGYRWWRIRLNTGQGDEALIGWVAEGNPATGEYWLEPRGILQQFTDVDGITRWYVVDDAGDIIERAECMRPPDDYTQVEWGFVTLNLRTVAMLQHAQRVYSANGGFVKFEDMLVQGSYTPGVSASFGTHDGGGAVDISVRSRVDFSVLTTEIMPMLDALRTAGFAAWLRAPGELYDGSPIHIHAIAIGDLEASEAARAQVDGTFGYLRGFNGLPQPAGQPPIADLYGEPVLCQWMREDGFEDLRTSD